MSAARPLSVSAYAPLSRSCPMNPRTAINCIACARIPTAAWSTPVAAQNRITRSWALSFVDAARHYPAASRRYGSFERRMQIPEDVEADKIEAAFKKGVLTVTLPKKPEAQKPAKKIEVKAA